MPASQFLEATMMDLFFGKVGSPYTAIATTYLGLSTQSIVGGATDAAILAGEPTSTGSYARVAVTNNTTNWPNVAGEYTQTPPAVKALGATFSFPASTTAWSTTTTPLVTVMICDASTLGGGHLLWAVNVNPSTVTVNASGITLQFAANSLQISLL